MTVSEIGLDYSALKSISNFRLNVSNTTQAIMDDIPDISNAMTNDQIGYIMLFGLFIIMYVVLADKTPLTDFGYSDARALALAFGLSAMMGVTLAEINYITDFTVVSFFTMLFAITSSFIFFYENKGASE